MRLQQQQEENHEVNRNEDEENNNKRDGASNDLHKSMRKEMDELKNAMREKTNKNLDGMVKMTDSPFTPKILECHSPPKFRLPQLEQFDGLRDPLDQITTFKWTLSLQQTPDEILYRSFLTTLKGAARVWFSKLT